MICVRAIVDIAQWQDVRDFVLNPGIEMSDILFCEAGDGRNFAVAAIYRFWILKDSKTSLEYLIPGM